MWRQHSRAIKFNDPICPEYLYRYETGPADIKPGQTIYLLMEGGTLRLGNGHVLSYGFESAPIDKQFTAYPGHHYLYFLKYHPDGNFYTGGADWQFKNGHVVPNNLCYVIAARKGHAHFAGMSKDAFIQAMRRRR